jgi:hypothetical protein
MNPGAAAALLGRLALGLAIFVGVPALARGASFTVCGEAGERIGFEVRFNSTFENAVAITDLQARQDVMTFNNHFGRGAGAEWRMGAGTWFTPQLTGRTCYAVRGSNKAGPANPALPWRGSAAKALAPNRWGFEDGGDADFNDVVVTVRRIVERRSEREPTRDTESRPATAPPAAPRSAPPPPVAAPTPAPAPPVAAPKPAPAPPVAAPKPAPAPPVAAAGRAPALPQFSPWPPPQASGREVIAAELVTGKGKSVTWGAVADRVGSALGKAGYRDLSHYAVPNGFAITTRVERIEVSGEPAAEPSRWVITEEPLSMSTWTLEGVLRRLAGAPLGHYRVIVFVFSPDAFEITGTPITQTQADEWRRGGLNRLPAALRSLTYGADFRCDALVYEFEQLTESQAAQLVAGRLSGSTHLVRSRILDELKRLP